MGNKDKSSFIENDLRRRISSGELRPGLPLPSENLLASDYNVSRMTLRKALENLKKNGILDSTKGAGTFVRAKVRDEIAIIGNAGGLYSEQGFFFIKLLENAQRLAQANAYHPVMHLDDGGYSNNKEFLTKLLGPERLESCAGIMSMTSSSVGMGKALDALGVPAVGHAVALPTLKNCVVLDYGAFIGKALEIFKGRGVEKFTCFRWQFVQGHGEPGHMHNEIDRLLDEMGKQAKVRMVYVPYSKDGASAYELFKSEWSRPEERPQHLLFADDAFCDYACHAISELGIDVPNQVDILTYANAGRKFKNQYPLTAIGFDPAEVVEEEWRLLRSLIAGEAAPSGEVVMLKPATWRCGIDAEGETTHAY